MILYSKCVCPGDQARMYSQALQPFQVTQRVRQRMDGLLTVALKLQSVPGSRYDSMRKTRKKKQKKKQMNYAGETVGEA